MLHLDFQNDILAPEDNMKYLNIQNTILHEHIKKPMIEVFVKQLESEDKYLLYHGLVGLRKLVSHENDPQIERAIQLGAVPLLFDVIKNNITPYHTYEACYSLTNVASGDSKQTATVADLGGVNLFVELTKCNFYDIVEQSIWALGNLAGDNNDYREEIIKLGGHKTIIQFALFCEEQMDNYKKSSSYAQCVWALTNLCLVEQINKDLINEIMPIVCRALNYQFLKQTIVEVLTSISQFTKHQEVINILIENQQQLKSLLGYLHNKDTEVIRLALNILIDISMGIKEQVNHLIQLKLLLYVPKLLEHKNFKIRKLTCQLLQMIAISSQEYTILILKDKQIMNKLCHLAINDDKIIEVIKIYFNMTEFLLVEDLQTLINYQFLNIIQNCIARQERGDINFVINSIKNLLKNIDPNLLRQQFYGFVQEIQNFATTQDWKQELQDLEYIQQKFDKYQMNQ